MDSVKPQINQLNTCEVALPMTNEFNLKCTNGYEISNLKLEGNDILFECDKKSEWRDIKDAPRDGTEILCYVKNIHYEGCEILRFSNGCWNNSFDGWYLENILGWIPLPEKPHKEHRCVNGDLICIQEKISLRLIHPYFSVKIDFCPFCGFTLKQSELSLMPDPDYRSVTIE